MTTEIDELPQEMQTLLEEFADVSRLEPLEPAEGVEQYLRSRRGAIQESTIEGYRTSLSYFIEFCEIRGIENLNDLSGRNVESYRVWRRDDSTAQVERLSTKTMNDEMYLFKSLLRYLASIDAVNSEVVEAVQIPELNQDDGVKDRTIDADRVQTILSYLKKYEYGGVEHVLWLLCAETGRRPSGLHSLDVSDVHIDGEKPYITFRHQSDTGLKKDTKSDSDVNISEKAAGILADYLEHSRINIEENGRSPLLTSNQGRLSTSTMRKYFYKYTRPCEVGQECPHDEERESCEAATNINQASKCPSAEPPYSSRHGHITALRRAGVPLKVISERCDVSAEVIEKHYDERSEEEKREFRRDILQDASDNTGGYL